MPSWLVCLALLAELLAYAAIGFVLAARGWPWIAIAAGAVLVAVLFRVAFVLAGLLIGRTLAGPSPRDARLAAAAAIRFFLRELAAVMGSNFVYMPFEPLVTPRDAPLAPARSVPIVLVHGYFVNRGFFAPLMRHLGASGRGPLFAPNLPSAFTTIEKFADALRERIEAITAATGQPRVILVCHSMGGLAARRYIATHGSARVAKLITIATPHAGTVLGICGLGRNAAQMCPNSEFLAALVRDEGARPRPPVTSIYSRSDNLVVPQETSRLDWARNVALDGLGHITILRTKATWRVIDAELDALDAAG